MEGGHSIDVDVGESDGPVGQGSVHFRKAEKNVPIKVAIAISVAVVFKKGKAKARAKAQKTI